MNFVHLELLAAFDNKKNLVKEIPEKPFKVSLRSNPSCHTLSKTFDISRKTPLNLSPSSNYLHIL